ncbi:MULTISPECIES: AraC family transcriptional regulator [unclassified Butyrivibrio]|uniref:AraC family transcriptional regulator n=1 Tax=unclassified Butyrivibrio TaxID=2639466 RepID=UPI0003B3907B|nr:MULTISPECIES: AraC family transcriptional regulator [unclassified Butyrivibrio]MDC7295136.1 AraC family transcriptional regulator [Butyrivibrio sp. DSM 10294]
MSKNREFDSSLSFEDYEQKGYLNQDFRFFHIKNREKLDIPYHYHDFDKLILVLGGKVKYLIEGREYELLPFDFVLVNRNLIHKPVVESSDDEYDRIILYLNHDFLSKYELTDAFKKTRELGSYVVRFPAAISTEVLELFSKIEEDIAVEDSSYAGRLMTRLDVLKALICFNRACIQEDFGFKPEARYNRKVIEIIEFIMDNLGNDLSIDFLADHFYMSKYHMMRIFKNETGYSIHQYISEKRILKARNLIMSGTPATNACVDCGFRDYSTFSRAFKNQLGVLPSEVKI